MLHLAFRVLGCAGVALGGLCEADWGRGIKKQRIGYTDMRRLTAGIRSDKCVVRRFRRHANVYLTAYYAPTLYGTAYCS